MGEVRRDESLCRGCVGEEWGRMNQCQKDELDDALICLYSVGKLSEVNLVIFIRI